MAPSRRHLLALSATAVGTSIAGCTGDDTGDGDGDGPTTSTPSGVPTTPTSDGTANVQVSNHPELGDILVDGEGMTLYMFDNDTNGAGMSVCTGDCLSSWPPLTTEGSATAGANVSAPLSTFDRGDGTTQVAAAGWPLYYWAGDQAPGDVNGQGVGGVWWVLRSDGTPVRPEPTTTEPTTMAGTALEARDHDEYGEILVDGDGLTLYMFDNDTQGAGKSSCAGDCADSWPPLTTDGAPMAGSAVTAAVTTFERADGATQVAANGWPLYYFASDGAPGDAAGQGIGGVWWVLRPDGTPVRPDPTTTTSPATVDVRPHSEHGDLLVDGDGMTLYMFDSDTQGEGASTCGDSCKVSWPPLTVDGMPTAADSVMAELTTFERDDGSTQVAANGWPLYYYVSDDAPGEANGQGVGDAWWVLTPSGNPMRS